MNIPTNQEIEEAAEQAGTNRFSKINGNTHRDLANEEHCFVEGHMEGSWWALQQLEPLITELGMENVRLKAHVASLEDSLRIATNNLKSVTKKP